MKKSYIKTYLMNNLWSKFKTTSRK